MAVLVGRKAPHFIAKAIVDGGIEEANFSLDQFLGKKKVLFFFYPKDFTFVCPTELHAFQDNLAEFESRDTVVVACSTDTEKSHWGWLQMDKDDGGIKGITYPIVADTNKTISKNFDVLMGDYYFNENDELVNSGTVNVGIDSKMGADATLDDIKKELFETDTAITKTD